MHILPSTNLSFSFPLKSEPEAELQKALLSFIFIGEIG